MIFLFSLLLGVLKYFIKIQKEQNYLKISANWKLKEDNDFIYLY